MNKCKKYRPAPTAEVQHHRQAGGSCERCVYFSQANCGQHRQAEHAPLHFSFES